MAMNIVKIEWSDMNEWRRPKTQCHTRECELSERIISECAAAIFDSQIPSSQKITLDCKYPASVRAKKNMSEKYTIEMKMSDSLIRYQAAIGMAPFFSSFGWLH